MESDTNVNTCFTSTSITSFSLLPKRSFLLGAAGGGDNGDNGDNGHSPTALAVITFTVPFID